MTCISYELESYKSRLTLENRKELGEYGPKYEKKKKNCACLLLCICSETI